MKIIFDNEEQMREFVDKKCPGSLGLIELKGDMCNTRNCEACWKASGVRLIVNGRREIIPKSITVVEFVEEYIDGRLDESEVLFVNTFHDVYKKTGKLINFHPSKGSEDFFKIMMLLVSLYCHIENGGKTDD